MHRVPPRLLLFASIVGLATCGTKQEAQSTRQQLHVTVHLLRVTTAPSLTTQTSDADARALVAEMNRIWSAAQFSVVIDKVQNEEAIDDAAAITWLTSSAGDEGPDAVLANLLRIRPPVSNQATIHIYFIGTIPCNGITMPPNAIFVQDNPRLRDVAGGAHDPRARVMAHELGHVFGLFHVDEPDRLMFGGSTGTRVTDSETATAVNFMTKAFGGRLAEEPSRDQ